MLVVAFALGATTSPGSAQALVPNTPTANTVAAADPLGHVLVSNGAGGYVLAPQVEQELASKAGQAAVEQAAKGGALSLLRGAIADAAEAAAEAMPWVAAGVAAYQVCDSFIHQGCWLFSRDDPAPPDSSSGYTFNVVPAYGSSGGWAQHWPDLDSLSLYGHDIAAAGQLVDTPQDGWTDCSQTGGWSYTPPILPPGIDQSHSADQNVTQEACGTLGWQNRGQTVLYHDLGPTSVQWTDAPTAGVATGSWPSNFDTQLANDLAQPVGDGSNQAAVTASKQLIQTLGAQTYTDTGNADFSGYRDPFATDATEPAACQGSSAIGADCVAALEAAGFTNVSEDTLTYDTANLDKPSRALQEVEVTPQHEIPDAVPAEWDDPSKRFNFDDPIKVTDNPTPDEMPVRVPPVEPETPDVPPDPPGPDEGGEPDPGDGDNQGGNLDYTRYLKWLIGAGLLGYIIDLNDTNLDPGAGPNGVANTPGIHPWWDPANPNNQGKPGPRHNTWTDPSGHTHHSTFVAPGSSVSVYVNPSDAPQATEEGAPVDMWPTAGGPAGPTAPGITIPQAPTPCSVFPFGIPCWTANQLGTLAGTPAQAPHFSVSTPSQLGGGPIDVNLDHPFGADLSSVMAVARPVLLFLSLIGLVWWLGGFALGGSTGGGGGAEEAET